VSDLITKNWAKAHETRESL